MDWILDNALGSYGQAEPLEGLEGRVLRRIRAADSRPRQMAWGGLAVACALTLICAAMVLRPPNPVPASSNLPSFVLPLSELRLEHRPATVAHLRPRTKTAREVLKRERFPTPTLLSAQERALVELARDYPAQTQSEFLDWQKRSDARIEIAPLEIAPLATDGGAQ